MSLNLSLLELGFPDWKSQFPPKYYKNISTVLTSTIFIPLYIFVLYELFMITDNYIWYKETVTLSALIFEGLNFRVTKILPDLICEIWLNSRKFAKYKSREISQKLQILNYHEIIHKRHKQLAKYILKSTNQEVREI